MNHPTPPRLTPEDVRAELAEVHRGDVREPRRFRVVPAGCEITLRAASGSSAEVVAELLAAVEAGLREARDSAERSFPREVSMQEGPSQP